MFRRWVAGHSNFCALQSHVQKDPRSTALKNSDSHWHQDTKQQLREIKVTAGTTAFPMQPLKHHCERETTTSKSQRTRSKTEKNNELPHWRGLPSQLTRFNCCMPWLLQVPCSRLGMAWSQVPPSRFSIAMIASATLQSLHSVVASATLHVHHAVIASTTLQIQDVVVASAITAGCHHSGSYEELHIDVALQTNTRGHTQSANCVDTMKQVKSASE